MITRYHIEITRKALGDLFSEASLKIITLANIRQDKIINQFGHDFIHFDSNAFEEGFNYIKDHQEKVIKYISDERYIDAQKALGRLLHTWQDFYSHSNYVRLWMKDNVDSIPSEIAFNDQQILTSPYLRSGKNYGVVEFVAMIPVLSQIITPLMPDDSHAKMNIDSPKSSPIFPYAYEAALKRSKTVHLDIMNLLRLNKVDGDKIKAFHGKSI